ncbi:gas vesicle protein K [Spirillospora albida]|uniref:gas vesicle protein K n=1 Tax=Spirillospora albida TaxID=58123 RepID=UPI0009FBE98D|nr:gas vesicle protein K [Spirillospora albida]
MTEPTEPRHAPVTGDAAVHDATPGDPFTDAILAGRTGGATGPVPVRAAPARRPEPEHHRRADDRADDRADHERRLRDASSRTMQRLRSDPETVERDLVKLVLTLVELIRQLMERQALRRAEGGTLTDEQTEQVGLALMRLDEAMTRLKDHFDLDDHDLNLDLGPLGPLLPD